MRNKRNIRKIPINAWSLEDIIYYIRSSSEEPDTDINRVKNVCDVANKILKKDFKTLSGLVEDIYNLNNSALNLLERKKDSVLKKNYYLISAGLYSNKGYAAEHMSKKESLSSVKKEVWIKNTMDSFENSGLNYEKSNEFENATFSFLYAINSIKRLRTINNDPSLLKKTSELYKKMGIIDEYRRNLKGVKYNYSNAAFYLEEYSKKIKEKTVLTEARDMRLKSAKFSEEVGDIEGAAQAYSNAAFDSLIYYKETKELLLADDSIEYYKKSMSLFDKTNPGKSRFINKFIGDVYFFSAIFTQNKERASNAKEYYVNFLKLPRKDKSPHASKDLIQALYNIEKLELEFSI